MNNKLPDVPNTELPNVEGVSEPEEEVEEEKQEVKAESV